MVGLTGGIATGKSVVARMLEKLGAHTIDFDVLARRVVEPDEPAWRDIVEYFGEQVLNEDRTINRRMVGDIVFQDSEKRKRLEAFTHPRIRDIFQREAAAIIAEDPDAIVVAVVPLLIENNLQPMFDHVVVVHVPEAMQIERIIERDRLSREAAVARIGAQMPIDEKIECADTAIDNSGALDQTRLQVVELWNHLRRLREESHAEQAGCPGLTS